MVQQVTEVARSARREREQLGCAAKQFVFRDYVEVEDPKRLLKGLLG